MSNLRDNLLNLEGSISTVLDNFFTSLLCIYNSDQSSIICRPDGIACATFAIGSRIINIRSPFSFLLSCLNFISIFENLRSRIWNAHSRQFSLVRETDLKVVPSDGNWSQVPQNCYISQDAKKETILPNETPCLHAPHLARGPRGRYPFFGWTVRAILAWHRGYSAYDLRQYFKTQDICIRTSLGERSDPHLEKLTHSREVLKIG